MRVLGTAGHVDHGKSTLVRRLTGIDPDRLAEEKAREMTIDLGFAWLTTPAGELVGIVDVPGHRDFIENMLAGVGGIDAVLLIVAADEGIMPQTREHLDILSLLDIQHGLVALTKIDMVDDPSWLELVTQDIAAALAPSPLRDAPILPVSARTGKGIPPLLNAIDALLAHTPTRPDHTHPRLPIDRVFTMSGFGTVVTGTLSGGVLRVGDEIELQPNGLRGRVRGLQSYKTAVEAAYPGSRVAVNITGIDKQTIQRGDVLAKPGLIQPTLLVDIRFNHLPDLDRPLKHNALVKVFSGTAESTAHVRLLDTEVLQPGDAGWAQLRLDSPLALAQGDRFILRYPSPPQTIGGGIIVDPHPARRWKRMQPDILARLDMQLQGSPAQRLAQVAESPDPLKRGSLQQQYAREDFDLALEAALHEGLVHELPDGSYWAATRIRALQHQLVSLLSQYHAAEPLRMGIPREELRSRSGLKNSTFGMLIGMQSDIVVEGITARLAGHTIQFNERQHSRIQALMDQMRSSPYTPPSYESAVNIVGDKVLRALIELGDLVQMATAPDVLFERSVYETMVEGILTVITTHGSVDAKTVRDHFNTSRKYAIALLEHLDEVGITQRDGDVRIRRAPR